MERLYDTASVMSMKDVVWEGHLDPFPGHARNATESWVRNLVERRRSEVEIGDFASGAAIGQSDCYALALIYRVKYCKQLVPITYKLLRLTGCFHLASTHGVLGFRISN